MFSFCNKYFLLMTICLMFVPYYLKKVTVESSTKYMCMYIFYEFYNQIICLKFSQNALVIIKWKKSLQSLNDTDKQFMNIGPNYLSCISS
jgi:hypothetical protein